MAKVEEIKMKLFFQMLLVFVMSGVTLSANASVSPQDPTFLSLFNTQQKVAIHNFLTQELGQSIENENKELDEDQLKQFFVAHLNSWYNKFGGAHLHKSLLTTQLKADNNFEELLMC